MNKRGFLKSIGVGTAGLGTFPLVTGASAGSPELTDRIVVETAVNSKQNQLAFTSYEESSLCLFLATGTTNLDDESGNIVQITSPSEGSIHNIHWEDSSTLSIWQNRKTRHLTVSESGSVTKNEAVRDSIVPGKSLEELSSEPESPGTDQIITPPPGGGYPDWYDNPDLDLGSIQECKHIKKWNVEWVDICVETESVSPKVYTKSCWGYEQPLVGGSVSSVSITTPAGGGSISFDLWFGVDPSDGCVYWGSEAAGVCLSNCSIPPGASLSVLEDALVDDIQNTLEDVNSIIDDITSVPGPNWATYASVALGAIIGAAILVILSPAFAALVAGGIGVFATAG